jgi:hypothetical protein
MLSLTKLRALDVVDGSAPPRHLSAASGLALVGASFYVVADDELHLGVFPASGNAPGRLMRLFPGALPAEKACRRSAITVPARCWRSAPAPRPIDAAARCSGSTGMVPSRKRRRPSICRACSPCSSGSFLH